MSDIGPEVPKEFEEEFLIPTYRKERAELIDRAWRKTHEAKVLEERLEALQREYNLLDKKYEELGEVCSNFMEALDVLWR